MDWKIEFTKSAEKEFSKLSKDIKLNIRNYLRQKIVKSPRDYGKPLVYSDKIKLWRYRVQDYRIICQIKDAEVKVLVIRLGKRDSVYKK
ncbi:MAG: type II toxin-antitoxin system RelE/ParE family toxin [Rickettsiaceae bacterium]|nr:type II toxin-antitoxin system RelE/ParE family toxin [Rickettsiaceae bacterium]